jgi:hypothetical protein
MTSTNPTAVPTDDDAFLAKINADIEVRREQGAAARKEQAERERVQAEFELVIARLETVEKAAPRNGYTIDDEPPPFDVKKWAGLIVDAATAWLAYHANFGEMAWPRVSDDYGHDAAFRIFCRALESPNVSTVAAVIEKLLPPFRLIGKKVHTKADRFFEGIEGLGDYFHLVAFEFGRRHGNLWQYEGTFLPGRIIVRLDKDGIRVPRRRSTRLANSSAITATGEQSVSGVMPPAHDVPARHNRAGAAEKGVDDQASPKQEVVIEGADSKGPRTICWIVEGHEVARAAVRGPALVRMFDIVVAAKGKDMTWSELQRAWMSTGSWKGRILSEATLRTYALRIRRALSDKGFLKFWRYSSECVSWSG